MTGKDGCFITSGALPQVPPFPAAWVAPAIGAGGCVPSDEVFCDHLADLPQIPPFECQVSEAHVRGVKILASLDLLGLSRSSLLFFSGLRPLGFLAQLALFKLGGDSPVPRSAFAWLQAREGVDSGRIGVIG
jgi:hypothetical protein